MDVGCDGYAANPEVEDMCLWFFRLRWMTVICSSFILICMAVIMCRKIRSKHAFVIIFALMIAASMILEILSLYPQTNYAIQDLNVYYYASDDATEPLIFIVFYQFVGYIYYSASIIFLEAHWLFGFVYLYTALNLSYQLQID